MGEQDRIWGICKCRRLRRLIFLFFFLVNNALESTWGDIVMMTITVHIEVNIWVLLNYNQQLEQELGEKSAKQTKLLVVFADLWLNWEHKAVELEYKRNKRR